MQHGVFDITACKKIILKCHHSNMYIKPVKFFFLFTQLREMRTARQSAEMPMKDQ